MIGDSTFIHKDTYDLGAKIMAMEDAEKTITHNIYNYKID